MTNDIQTHITQNPKIPDWNSLAYFRYNIMMKQGQYGTMWNLGNTEMYLGKVQFWKKGTNKYRRSTGKVLWLYSIIRYDNFSMR